MRLDLRSPIGLMFAIFGIVLVLSGFLMDKAIYQRSLGINVNLWWGLVLLAFGIVMLYFGRRGGASAKLAEESVEGKKIEERELGLGLEEEGCGE